ncbi:4Fe-4S binding protein [Candidatus Bathyarchaeota archaeon]|nr:4Fe-4S binding protein [Candidatus Bathyarchaeota archaeon]
MKVEIKQRLLKFNTPRRIVQFLSFVLFSAVTFNLGVLPILLPVLWTWGFPGNIIGDSFTAMQFTLSGWNDFPVAFPWLAVASFLIVGILIGKSMCGWICPFGFIQDLIDFVKRKKTVISPRTHRNIIYLKYIVLGAALFISVTFSATKLAGVSESYESALGIFAKAPFTTLSPAESLFATLPKLVLGFRNAIAEGVSFDGIIGAIVLTPIFWIQMFVMVAILVFAALVPRSFCKYLCPHGAIMAIMNRFSFIGLRRDPVKCSKEGCRQCVEVCPMDIPILDLPWEKFSDPECIYCLKCVDACEHKAIKIKYP